MANSSSSSSSVWKYDVFLSFRGIDTRKSFVGFLYKELERKCVKTFKDDEELKTGSSISPELNLAIEGSRFAIVVVSENYASSRWCLEELSKIMKCERTKSLTAIPIFYEVDPSDVRHQKGKFAEDFEKHEKRENPENVKKWRDALRELANKSGMDSRNWKDNAEFIDEITKDISRRLNSTASSDFTDLIGMDVHMKAMYRMLDLESNNEVRLIGIWGMGGVGKTTLAGYVYENIKHQFQAYCFLEDVKKIFHDSGPLGIRKELVSRIREEDQRNSDLGAGVIKEMFGCRKVLLVVDDVDNFEQLHALAKEDGWFGPGSRVIMTTRDMHLIDSCGIRHRYVYEVNCLQYSQGLQLFCQFAFKQKLPPDDNFQELSKRAVNIARGLPLALRVFGAYLSGRDENFWKNAFGELERSMDPEVMKILRISYDGLREGEKDLFLNVACLFNGGGRLDFLMDVLGEGIKSAIEALAEKCLISISWPGYHFRDISMHDLVKQMGTDLGKHKILWKPDEIYEVLSNNWGAEAIETIALDVDKVHNELIIGRKTFKKMPNLKLLRIFSSWSDGKTKLQLPYDVRISFPSLRHLSWVNYPSKVLQLRANTLVTLKLRDSRIEKLWEGSPRLENLKEIDVSQSKYLEEFPDFSAAPNLEVVNAAYCTRLTEIPPSICSLKKLTRLYLFGCEGLQRVPNNIDMKFLQDFYTDYELRNPLFPERCLTEDKLRLRWEITVRCIKPIYDGTHLKGLRIVKPQRLEHLPQTIADLSSLEYLVLSHCQMLQSIPETIWKLRNLQAFMFCDGQNITKFPNLPKSIRKVFLTGTMIEEIPSSIGDLCLLEHLDISKSKRLKNLPGSIYKLKCLKVLYLEDCPCLQSFPSRICDTGDCFAEHDTEERSSRRLPPSNLEKLFISRGVISDCLPFHFPLFSGFPFLRRLHLINLSMREIADDPGLLTNLEELDLRGNDFEMIPASIIQLTKLSELRIDDCVNLYSLSELPPNIKVLSAEGCSALAQVSEIFKFNFTNKRLGFAKCFKLKEDLQLSYKHMVSVVGDGAVVVLPGSEVPSCFDHRNKGSSLTISLPFGSSPAELIGFVACIVVVDHVKDIRCVEWKCAYSRRNCGTSVLCDKLYLYGKVEVQSGHMLFFNGDLRLKEDKAVVFYQISFELSVVPLGWKNFEPPQKIKECGVYLQYTPSSSSTTFEGSSSSGPCQTLEAENNAMDGQDDVVNEPSTKRRKLF